MTPGPKPLSARRPATGLRGDVRVPGDKSISHRALMFGAMAVGETRITGLLEGEDVLRTAAAMRALGATVTQDAPGVWRVSGRGVGGMAEPADVLDMGNSGTAARLLTGILASHGFFSVMTGDASLRGRPMRRVTDPLAACGARFQSRDGGRLPLAIQGASEPLPLTYTLPVASAQVKSAVLLCGLNARGVTTVTEPVATRDHSENMLRHFGADVSVTVAGGGRVDPPRRPARAGGGRCGRARRPVVGRVRDRRRVAGPGVRHRVAGYRLESAADRPDRDVARDGRRHRGRASATRRRRAGRRPSRPPLGITRRRGSGRPRRVA